MSADRYACPDCGSECEADYVDIGVGEQRCGPWVCHQCGWIERPDTSDYLIEDEDWK